MNLEELLLKVDKPARYIGNEINMVKKDISSISIRFAFCFPDVYEVGMSHLGMQILYFFLNRREDTYCERVFAPWVDMEQLMRENSVELFSLETFTSLKQFDFLGFTLQYEMSFTNIINMLSLSNIPFYAADRDETFPILCAGGPCAYNPEPLAEIFDFFYIGEGEANLDSIMDLYKANKAEGGTKTDFLEKLLKIEGVYVPKFYDVSYKETGELESFTPNHPDAPSVIRKVIVNDLSTSFYPETQLLPLIEIVHDRVALEVFRGCMRGCRFCQAGYVYRPVRERDGGVLLDCAKKLMDATGHEEISLLSLSTGDYTQFKQVATQLVDTYAKDSVNISLPSLRIDAFTLELLSKVQEVRKSSLTFAPEAGTQRLRDVINKGITEDEIIEGCRLAFNGGFNRIKLYFMLGLPTETHEDVVGIVKLAEKLVEVYYELPKEQRARPVSISVSASCFVPKAFTPFQWSAQDGKEDFFEKITLIKKTLSKKQIRFTYHDPKVSILEGVVARGDRRISKLIIKAWENGARFDGWTEMFKYDIWQNALEAVNLDMKFYAARKRHLDELLPWDHISAGISKDFLKKEFELSEKEEITENCRKKCTACGAAAFGGGVCFEQV